MNYVIWKSLPPKQCGPDTMGRKETGRKRKRNILSSPSVSRTGDGTFLGRSDAGALFHAGPGLVWSIISHQDIVNPFKLAKPKPLIWTIPTFSKFTSKLIISASYNVCHVKKEPCVGGAWKGSRSWQDARRRERSQGISWKLRLWGKTVQGEGFLLRRKSPRKVLQERKRMA